MFRSLGLAGQFAQSTCFPSIDDLSLWLPVLQDGLGQKYGAPRRNAQEKIRSEVARSEVAAAKIDELLELLVSLCKRALDAELGTAEAAKEKVGKYNSTCAREEKPGEASVVREIVSCVSPGFIFFSPIPSPRHDSGGGPRSSPCRCAFVAASWNSAFAATGEQCISGSSVICGRLHSTGVRPELFLLRGFLLRPGLL